MRIDLYGLVHKAQRHHLFGFAQELGRADLEDEAACAKVAAGVRQIVDMLRDHAQNEERYIHPLYARLRGVAGRSEAGGEVASLEAEHRTLEARLDELSKIVESRRYGEVYRCLMRFIGEYLVHMDDEERAQAEVLWPHYSDAELGAVFACFQAERAPEAARADWMLLLPALNVTELGRVRAKA